MDVDTRLLRSFAAVCEEGQLTAAAARLFVSQPTLTKQIRQLEALLGVELFERSRRGMAPTPAGRALAERAGTMLAGWDDALRATRAAAAEQGSTLRVGFEGSTINVMTRSTVADFTRRMPGWQVELRQNNWFDPTSGLATGEIDLTLWHAPPSLSGQYNVAVLGEEPRCVALPAGHRLANRAVIDFEELLDEPFVAIPHESGHWRDYWLAVRERGGRPVRIGAVAHNADEWLAAVVCGQGVGFAPETMSRLAAREDVAYRPVRGLAPSQVGLYWPKEREQTPAMAAFVQSCRVTVASPAGREARPQERR
ncbi:LysR family transcriptional regulator [Streptomyces sp. CB01881]|uniref:LysR family transcriptional regulator n=1 Tax=Streptomyces sp. CB01881 TaxID=2078691 RepID=UPI0011DF75CC|nr:LysR family transcriptional regulator [Streptomyces sp. CB01881]TYC68382.1 LysR family transcriptional regulator [Streptomyces sp. CB01881]